MPTYVSRAEWGARPHRAGPGPLLPSNVEGVALHWPAMSKPLRGIAAVSAALRGWQNDHMDDRGWSDIGYQEAIDQDGNVYELRGLGTQSGANGDQDVNKRFGAILLVLAPGEQPTAVMIVATRRRIARHRELFPRSKRIVGHNDIRPEPTACPGPIVTAKIHAGVFEPHDPTRGKNLDAAESALVKARAANVNRPLRLARIKALLKQLRGGFPRR